MKIRDTMNNNSAVVTIVAVVILVLSLGFIIMNSNKKGPRRVVELYYYDMNTGELFVGPSDQYAPIDAPSGPTADGQPAGVRAYVFSCGDCSDKSSHYIGYLERYSPEAKERIRRMNENPESLSEEDHYYDYDQGRFVMVPDKTSWLEANSEAGIEAASQVTASCPEDSIPRSCYPGR